MNVEWKDDYKIGHEAIDEQHQNLFKLTNALMVANDVDAVRNVMVQLYKHTREHFELEEAVMRHYKFPELLSHTESHNRLLANLNQISEEVGRGRLDKTSLVQLMTEWSLHHVPKDDARLASFLTS